MIGGGGIFGLSLLRIPKQRIPNYNIILEQSCKWISFANYILALMHLALMPRDFFRGPVVYICLTGVVLITEFNYSILGKVLWHNFNSIAC